MKKHEIIFQAVKVPLDFLIILISFFIAREIRLVTDLIPSVSLPIQTIELYPLLLFAVFGAFLYVFLCATHGLYSTKITSSKIKEFLDIIRYSIYWFMFFSVFVFLGKGVVYEGVEIPRLIILFTMIIGAIFVILERVVLNNLQYSLLRNGFISKKKLILINNKKVDEIKYILKDIKKSKIYKLVGYINKEDVGLKNIKYLGSKNDFAELLEKKGIDEILFIHSDFGKKDLYEIWDLSRIFGVRYRYVTNYFDITNSNTSLSLINSIPVIELESTPLNIWGRVIKRVFDIVLSIIGILIFSPVMIVVAILIKLDDTSAPVIYKNRRIGFRGKEFSLYKFRYLKWNYCVKDSYGVDEKEDSGLKYEKELIKNRSSRSGPLYKIKNDPRKTKIGKIIEKYSLDELPQFFNVLIGNMSLVGPRPHQPREVKNYKLEERRLLTIKPGITGMAQVNGREKNTFEDEAKLDIFYIENWNLLLDLKIIFKTFGKFKVDHK